MIIFATNIDTTCTIFNKALQILWYADDLDIITRDNKKKKSKTLGYRKFVVVIEFI